MAQYNSNQNQLSDNQGCKPPPNEVSASDEECVEDGRCDCVEAVYIGAIYRRLATVVQKFQATSVKLKRQSLTFWDKSRSGLAGTSGVSWDNGWFGEGSHIRNWLRPANLTQVWSFLGLARVTSCCRRFIANFVEITHPFVLLPKGPGGVSVSQRLATSKKHGA